MMFLSRMAARNWCVFAVGMLVSSCAFEKRDLKILDFSVLDSAVEVEVSEESFVILKGQGELFLVANQCSGLCPSERTIGYSTSNEIVARGGRFIVTFEIDEVGVSHDKEFMVSVDCIIIEAPTYYIGTSHRSEVFCKNYGNSALN